MKRKIKLGIGNLNQAGHRFIETWEKVERGEPVESQEYLTFDDLKTLLRVLTPTRWTLLRFLRKEGPMSVRALSKSLARDYKNVHRDVREMERVGLVTKSKESKVMVQWDILLAEVRLEAA